MSKELREAMMKLLKTIEENDRQVNCFAEIERAQNGENYGEKKSYR